MQTMTAESSDVRRWIESFGVPYEFFDALPIDVINKDASLINQARRDPLDSDVAIVYGQAMKAGSVFPAVVGYFAGTSVILIDGNHRLDGATRAGASTMAAYIVDLPANDPRLLDMVASANATLNGSSATADDRMRHAVRMVDAGTSQAAAARLCGVKLGTLSNQLRAEVVLRKCDRLGVGREARRAPQHYMISINSHMDSLHADTLRALIGATESAKNREEFKDLVRQVAAMDVEDGVAQIQGFISERQGINSPAKTKKGQPLTSWKSFKMHATAITAETPESIMATCPPDQREAIARLADELRYIASRVISQ